MNGCVKAFGGGAGVHGDDWGAAVLCERLHREEPGVGGDAGFSGETRICRFQVIKVRHGVGAIGGVEEERAGFAVVVREGDDLVEQIAGAHRARHRAVARADQREVGVGLHGLHERVGDAHGDVEVADLAFFGLATDEIFDVGVIHAQDGHVGAAAGAALRHLAERDIVDAQEADRPGGDARAGGHGVVLGAQPREGEAVAAAGLLDQRGVAQGLEDAVGCLAEIIGDRQDEAGRELAQGRACAGERGRVREEPKIGEQRVERIFGRTDVVAVGGIGFGHGVGHAAEHPLDIFDGLAVQPLAQIPLAQHLPAVLG